MDVARASWYNVNSLGGVMLTPIDEGERLVPGPFDFLCIVTAKENSGVFFVVTLEDKGVEGFPLCGALPTIELHIGTRSIEGDLASARACFEMFRDRFGFDDHHIIPDRAIILSDLTESVIFQNWNTGRGSAIACAALCSSTRFEVLRVN